MRPINIGVGYTWSSAGVRGDARWKAISGFVKAAATNGLESAAASLASRVSLEDEMKKVLPASGLPRVSVSRLRASAGRFTWEHISQRIHEADILVFDVSPVAKGTDVDPKTSNNVWIEIGHALALPGKEVFVVHEDAKGHAAVPSDLAGLIIGHIPNTGKATDTSLRMSLSGAVRRLALRALETNATASANGPSQAVDKAAAAKPSPRTRR